MVIEREVQPIIDYFLSALYEEVLRHLILLPTATISFVYSCIFFFLKNNVGGRV